MAHLLAGSKSFHRREEVETLRAALTAIEWPDDELSVFATLKGRCSRFRTKCCCCTGTGTGGCIRFIERRCRRSRRSSMRPGDTGRAASRAQSSAVRGHGERAAGGDSRACRIRAASGREPDSGERGRVAELARTFEMSGGISFRGFVEELAAQAEKEEAAEAPVLEEDSDGVRLMTVHGAKGLEFPVVILADLTAGSRAREPDQFVDAQARLERDRLLRCAPRELGEHEPKKPRASAPRECAWRTSRRRGRGICWWFRRLATSRFRRRMAESAEQGNLSVARELAEVAGAPGCPEFGRRACWSVRSNTIGRRSFR